jgi:hypothetical protein
MSTGLKYVSGLRPPTALCSPPPGDMNHAGIITLTWETEELWEKLSQCRFVHHKSHVDLPGRETGKPRREAGD